MMPIVASTLTPGQWDAWEQEYYVKTKSKKDLGLEGHWLIDGGGRAVYDHVVGKVNPVLRFVLLRVFGPRYRKECVTRWGADVPVGPKLSEPPSTEQPEIIGTPRRPWRTRGEVSLHIDAPPERLYDLVADVGSTPTRSQEVQACLWLEGLPPGTVGSRFRGRNRAGLIRWSRVCEVVTTKRGEEFAFRTVPERFDPTRRDSSVLGLPLRTRRHRDADHALLHPCPTSPAVAPHPLRHPHAPPPGRPTSPQAYPRAAQGGRQGALELRLVT